MTKILDVYLQKNLVGILIQDEHGQMQFEYLESWIEKPNAISLSYSLPLRKKRYSQKECRGFFMGLLPEENQRELIAKNIGISARNDFALLQKIGGECAGAVTFINHDQPLPLSNNHYRILTENKFAEILQELPKRPLLAGEEGIRLSLAGAQNKVAALVTANQIAIPLDNSPSTHIIKPSNTYSEGLVYNERFCMELAAAAGLPTAQTEIKHIKKINYLLIKRYDRKITAGNAGGSPAFPTIERLHQEDFCQALGIPSTMKYQNEGGPSLKQCFNLIREVSSTPVIDLQSLLDGVIYNFIIGNHDAHGKNFSILYDTTENQPQIKLAPFYDFVSTIYYPQLSKKMAMKIGGEYSSDKITREHFEKLASEVELTKSLVIKRVIELNEKILFVLSKMEPDNSISEELAETTTKHCKSLLLKISKI